MSEALTLFTRVQDTLPEASTKEERTGTAWGLFAAKMDGEPEEDDTGRAVFNFVASEPVEDRHRDVVASDWQLDNFRANPVLPWGHESWNPPVGRALRVELDAGGRLMLRAQFDDSPVNPKGQLVAHQYREGFLNAVSVGFVAGMAVHRSDLEEDHPHAGDRGYLLSRNELLEVSPVTIPALPSALLQRGCAEETIRNHGDFQRMWRRFYAQPVTRHAREETAEALVERSPSGVTADALIALLKAPRHVQHLRSLLGLNALTERVGLLEEPPPPTRGLTLFGG